MSPAALSRPLALACLVAATVIWGLAFVAQKSAMDSMGPLTFMAARFILGGLVVLPLVLREHRRVATPLSPRQWALAGALSLSFFLGAFLQQAGLMTTTVTNGGFLTGLYVFFVPVMLLLAFRTKPHRAIWACAPLALLGLFLLNGGRLDAAAPGDGLVTASAIFWAAQVVLLGVLAIRTRRPILLSALSFLVTGCVSLAGALAFEAPELGQLGAGWIEILYAGLLSTALGFTLQAIGQQHVPPANAAIVLSGESLFAALGGALVLGERLSLVGYAGAGLLFLAIVLVETIPLRDRRPVNPRG